MKYLKRSFGIILISILAWKELTRDLVNYDDLEAKKITRQVIKTNNFLTIT